MKRLAPPPEPTLTVSEQRIIAALRAMDAESRRDLQVIADGYARDFPRRAPPGLRLVSGGAS